MDIKNLDINFISSIKDVSKYRFFLNKLCNQNLIKKIEKQRNKFYNKTIKSFDKQKLMFDNYKQIYDYIFNNNVDVFMLMEYPLFKELSNFNKHNIYMIMFNNNVLNKEEELLNLFQKISTDYYFELVIDHYFKEIPYNLLIDLTSMLEFNLNNKILSKNKLNFYKKLLECKEKYDEKFYSLFDDNINYEEMFYDDFKKCQNKSYELINNAITKPTKINENLSKKYNTIIYDFQNEPFFMLIHNTSIKKDSTEIKFYNNQEITSISLISDRLMGRYNSLNDTIILGFDYINPDNIGHIYNSDSYSSKKIKEFSTRVNRLYSPSDLINNTKGYNEIVYVNKFNSLRPSYIICFDEVNELDVLVSINTNLPIIRIDKKSYKNILRSNIEMGNDGDKYVRSYEELINLRKGR